MPQRIEDMEREELLKRTYGRVIFERGLKYFEEGNVTQLVKFKDKLVGEVLGTDEYRTEVDLNNLECRCSCPYSINCKHGVAAALQYFSGAYLDKDKIMDMLNDRDRVELKNIISYLVEANPKNLGYLDEYVRSGDIETKELDRQIRSKLRLIENAYADLGFVEDFVRFIKLNEDALTKEQVLHILEFLIMNCEEFEFFYDHYSDSYFGDPIFENLGNVFVKKEIEEDDLTRISILMSKDDYEMLDPFIGSIISENNAVKLKDFKEKVGELTGSIGYIQFLINIGDTEEATYLVENAKLVEKVKFELYLRIDEEKAVEFARKRGFYSSLISYYYKRGEKSKVEELFTKVMENGEDWKLDDDPFIYQEVLNSLTDKKVLRLLFDKCYSLGYYGICVDTGMKLEDKEIMRKLLKKNTDHFQFPVTSKIRLMDYLKEDYPHEVKEELKEFIESLINQKNNYSYEKAVKCAFILRKIMDEGSWEGYIKKIYESHFRKINLWKEFKSCGVSVKRDRGAVIIE
ncbi:MAG: SWIM zinc finger domain-containing protein [Archaeoglobaceae archaeon]